MSKFVKVSDVKQTLLEMSKEKTRSVGWGDVLMERLKDLSIEVSEDCISRKWLEENAEFYSQGLYDEGAWAVPLSILDDAPSVVPSREAGEDDIKDGRLDFVKKTIETHIDDALCGIFFSRNIAGDPMTHLNKGFGIDIEICYPYEYFEVFGLTASEQDTIKAFYDQLSEARRKR